MVTVLKMLMLFIARFSNLTQFIGIFITVYLTYYHNLVMQLTNNLGIFTFYIKKFLPSIYNIFN